MKRKINPIIYNDYMPNLNYDIKRGILYEIHIADLHFGSIDPKIEYDILYEQFILKINTLKRIDIICINGDIFDKKMMANSPAIYYAIKFIGDIVLLSKRYKAAVIMTTGTPSHEANQYNVLYQFLDDRLSEVYIVDHLQFIYTHGAKILCIPELHGIDEEVYHNILNYNVYDQAVGHMTFKGGVYGDIVTGNSRLFSIEDFLRCRGPIIAGHIHTPMCLDRDFYYCGSPIRYRFNEEDSKGFLIVIYNLDTREYYTHFEEIKSFRYDTIELNDIISNDPKVIISYIDNLKTNKNIDYLKIRFRYIMDGANKNIISNYYINRKDIKLEFYNMQEEQIERKNNEKNNTIYGFITNNKLSDEEKFVQYVNTMEGYEFITIDKLKSILENDI